MGAMQERITSTKNGSITSVQAVYVPADDLTDPAPATTFAHLDATTVLSRKIAGLGIYPAVDPLDSTSRILNPEVVGEEHYKVARGVQEILQKSHLLRLWLNLIKNLHLQKILKLKLLPNTQTVLLIFQIPKLLSGLTIIFSISLSLALTDTPICNAPFRSLSGCA